MASTTPIVPDPADSAGTHAEIPTAEIVDVHWCGEDRHVTIRCPLCKRKHYHGVPRGEGRQPTHRAAHCSDSKPRKHSGYWIPPVEGWQKRAAS